MVAQGLALDTNIAINILNGNKKTIDICSKYYPIYLPITVCGELMFGAINSRNSKDNIFKYQNFITECQILNTTSLVALEYAKIRKSLKELGKPIPENDIWIAALCKSYDILLATQDKHFKNITDLSIFEIEN